MWCCWISPGHDPASIQPIVHVTGAPPPDDTFREAHGKSL